MLNIVIFGAPGAGKGTQSALLKEKYGLIHISTGDVLRAEIKEKTEIGLIAEGIISKGQLVPDGLIIDILKKKRAEQEHAKGFIIDGFPRTLAQAEALKVMLQGRGADVLAVIALEVEESVFLDRLVKRGADSGRSDDNLETIQKRLNVYNTQTAPLIDYYKKDDKYFGVNGVGSVDEIFGRITAIIDNLK